MRAEIAGELSSFIGADEAGELTRTVVRAITPSYADAEIVREAVAVDSVVPLSRLIVGPRKRRARHLVEASLARGIPVFSPVVLKQASRVRIVFPPLVEAVRGERVLMDGTHRMVSAREAGLREVYVSMVHPRAPMPLPCEKGTWSAIRVAGRQPEIESVLAGFNPHFFRPATTTFNSGQFIFPSLERLARFCFDVLSGKARIVPVGLDP